jgi:drug/metabolite transporter (DMT)-like permease
MAHLAFLFVCIVWGSCFILLERVTHVFSPVEIGIWRLLSGAAALGVIWWWRRDVYRLERRDWGPILLSALVANVPPYVSQPYVIAQGYGHSFFGVIVAGIPLLTILMSIPMLGVRPTGRQLCGVLGGLVCLWFVVDDGFDRGMSLGLLALAFLVPLTGAFNNVYVKWKLPHAAALPMTAAMLGSAGLMLLPLEFCPPALEALDLVGPTGQSITWLALVYMLLLGVVATGLSTAAFFYMVLKEGPLFAGMTTYVVPMLALTWGQLDHERISVQQLAAMGGVLAMVALVQFGSRRAEVDSEPVPAGLIPAAALENLCRDGPLPVAVPALAPVVSESSVPSPQPLATDPDAPTSLAC